MFSWTMTQCEMFVLVLVLSFLSVSCGGSSSDTSSKAKSSSKYNSVPYHHNHKTDNFYHATTPTTPQPFPYNFFSSPKQSPFIPQAPHHQMQPTMVVIAHPSILPNNLLNQLNLVQHMITYFQNNPQARYQLFYGINQHQQQPLQQQQQQQQQPSYIHPTMQSFSSPASGPAYQPLSPTPYQPYVAPVQQPHVHMEQIVTGKYTVQGPKQPQPPHMDISHLAQSVAQQFASKGGSPPAIITGLEHFSPEQQAQIKAQLGLGATSGEEGSNSAENTSAESNKVTTTISANPSPKPKASALRSSFFKN